MPNMTAYLHICIYPKRTTYFSKGLTAGQETSWDDNMHISLPSEPLEFDWEYNEAFINKLIQTP